MKTLVDVLTKELKKLARPEYNARLVRHMVAKMRADVPRPSFLERRRLRRLFASADTWSLLIETSITISPALIEQVSCQISHRRGSETRSLMAQELAELAVSELPGALDVEDSFNFVIYQIRQVADQVRADHLVTAELNRLMKELHNQRALPDYLSADLLEYRRQLTFALLARRPKHTFRLTYRDNEGEICSTDRLTSIIKQNPQTAVHAAAGSGKSVVLLGIAEELNSTEQYLVIFVDLKSWPHSRTKIGADDFNDGEDRSLTIDSVLEASITKVTSNFIRDVHESLSSESKEIWLVDGINELSSDLSDNVLNTIQCYLRDTMRSSLVVTDRSDTRYSSPDWMVVRINQLQEDEVNKHLPVTQSHTDTLGRRDLLRTPFFLEIALADGQPNWNTSVQAIHSLFSDRIRLSESEIDAVAEYALSTYARGIGLPFKLDDMVSHIGADLTLRILESRVMEPVQDNIVTFYHQLIHDYLASRCVSEREEIWVPEIFDALSFDANTYEAVFMILDQLKSENEVVNYLTALYNWNWFGTVRCIERALRAGLPVPHHLKLVVCSMLAEKRFDAVEGSRNRANEWSRLLDQATSYRFASSASLADVVAEVGRSTAQGQEPEWFKTWFALFERLSDPGYRPSEIEVSELSSPNPFVGWIAAAVMRRCSTDDITERQVRAIYRGAKNGSDDVSSSVRWRAVHAVGTHPSKDNAQLLIDAIDNDTYVWVVYGAVRSLLEMAALADEESREKFLSAVDDRLSQLPAEPLSQVAWGSRYDGASIGWEDRVWPLLEHARDLQVDEKERERWEHRMAGFKLWASRRTP